MDLSLKRRLLLLIIIFHIEGVFVYNFIYLEIFYILFFIYTSGYERVGLGLYIVIMREINSQETCLKEC